MKSSSAGENWNYNLVFSFLLFAIFLPYIAVLFIPSAVTALNPSQIFEVWLATIAQATLSAALGTCGGFWGMTFLLRLDLLDKNRWRKATEFLGLIPSLVPPLCIVLGYFKMWPGQTGFSAVILVQGLVNVGFAAVSLRAAAIRRLRPMAEMAQLLGAKPWPFFISIAWPLLRRPLLICFTMIFAWSAAAFTIPILVGGTRATTLEVLIFQKVMIEGSWNSALAICLIQALTIFSLVWVLSREEKFGEPPLETWTTPYLTSSTGLLILSLPMVLVLAALIGNIPLAWQQMRAIPSFWPLVGRAFLGSLLTVLLTLGFLYLLMSVLIWLKPSGWNRKFLLGYSSPSAAILGLGLIVIFGPGSSLIWLRLALGLTLLSLPMAYRVFLDLPLQSLRPQVEAAELMGANRNLIFRKVTLIQMRTPMAGAMSLAAVWCWGDYSISAIVADRDRTLALVMKSLMGSYRLDSATLILWLILLAGFANYIVIKRWGRVSSP